MNTIIRLNFAHFDDLVDFVSCPCKDFKDTYKGIVTIGPNRGVARNFGLGGPSYIFIYTYNYTAIYIYIYILEIIIFINFNEYKQIVYFAINMYKNVLPLFNCNFFKSLIFGVISSP